MRDQVLVSGHVPFMRKLQRYSIRFIKSDGTSLYFASVVSDDRVSECEGVSVGEYEEGAWKE